MNIDAETDNQLSPTIRDLAKASGYSLGTVSLALNNKPGVSQETRARVLQTAIEIGYKLPEKGKNDPLPMTIGLLLKPEPSATVGADRFYSVVMGGAERECQRQGINLMYATLEVDDKFNVVRFPKTMFKRDIDGYIVLGARLDDTVAELRQRADKNVVLVDAYAPNQMFDSVVTDNLNGAYKAVTYLIENGHQHIGLIGSTPGAYPSILERRKGYSRALKHHHIATSYIEDSLLNHESGYEGTMRLLKRAPEVTAIFACNDNVAAAVIQAANDMERSVPKDLSVIGFDNVDLSGTLVPPLTTVHVDKALMGEIAVWMLCRRLEFPTETTITMTLSTDLVIRKSVRSLKSR